MIIGTTSQLGTIAIVTAAGMLIAFVISRVPSDRGKLILSGIIALLVGVLCAYRVYTAIRDSDIQGAFIAVFFSILAFFVTIGAFANAKEC
jgi:FtsH-binding integral membrane protein